MLRSLKCIVGPAFSLVSLACAQTLNLPQSEPQTSASSPPGITIRTGTKLVIVDVTVTGKNGEPIHNLKRSDFTVLESSKLQTVGTFEEHTALAPGEFPVASIKDLAPVAAVKK